MNVINVRVCSRCGQTRRTDEFKFRNRAKGLRYAYCRPCSRAENRRHYERNKSTYKDGAAARQRENKELVRALKASTPCNDCGNRFPYYVMEFDHRNPDEKSFQISTAFVAKGRLRILAEIEKCDVVCANCHRIRTHGALQRNGRYREKWIKPKAGPGRKRAP